MLTVENLCVSYGKVAALQNVDFCLERGQIVSIIGSNGAGKTTLLNAISGVVKRMGKIYLEGKVLCCEPYKVVKEGIIQVPEGRKIFSGLSVEENLLVGAYLNSNKKEVEKMLDEQYEIFPILKERRNQHGGMLSGGEQQMLAIARGMMSKPKILLLDEPSLGLAPKIVENIFNIIQDIQSKGVTVLAICSIGPLTCNVATKLLLFFPDFLLSRHKIYDTIKSKFLSTDYTTL